MFRKDYWKRSDDELKQLAEKYQIDTESGIYNDSLYVYDREKTIRGLVERDSALRATFTTILSILALVLSGIALVVSLIK